MEERLNEILRIALKYDVTDIHFSLSEEKTVIMMRVRGEMVTLKPVPSDTRLFRYLMYRGNLDLSRAHLPQTGSFETEVGGTRLSLRFAAVSGWRRTDGVLRILNNHSQLKPDDLTENPEDRQWLKSVMTHRSGLFLFTGPTGSGKTTTLYTLLSDVKGKAVYTVEDPVEIWFDSFSQLQVNEKAHLSYAECIRQLMRHDPDIIMIGEIRDSEAAKMAVRCALTGHLVVTTLHSFSCVSAIHRMEELGVDPYQLRDVLAGISCQRLYETAGGRTGVYEIMNRKEADYYFENHHTDRSFLPLSRKIREAAENGIIRMEDARADIAE